MTKKQMQIRAWREARVANYERTRSLRALATMVVELEDNETGCLPEFEIDDEWPAEVRHLRVK